MCDAVPPMHSPSATSYAYHTRVVCFSCTLHARSCRMHPPLHKHRHPDCLQVHRRPALPRPFPAVAPPASCHVPPAGREARARNARDGRTEANATRVGGTGDLRAGGLPPEQPVRQILGRVQRPQASAGSLLQSGGAPWGAAHVLLGGCCRRTRHSRFFGGDARCVRCDACTRRGDSRRVWRGW